MGPSPGALHESQKLDRELEPRQGSGACKDDDYNYLVDSLGQPDASALLPNEQSQP